MAHMPLPLNAALNIGPEVLQLLGEQLGLTDGGESLHAASRLLGELVATDSKNAANLVTAVEQRFCIHVAESDLEAGSFATVGALVDFIVGRLT